MNNALFNFGGNFYNMPAYVNNPWINPNTIEQRDYQDSVVKTAVRGNTLCVLPTGLGKTSIAALVAVDRLQKYPDGKILFLAPTRPLVNQHKTTFEKCLKLGVELQVVTGEDDPNDRIKLYTSADIIFSTPQTIGNDVKRGVLNLTDFSLCIFDEAHRCVGNYAYIYIAKRYIGSSKNPLILALTASPGSHRYKIDEIRNKLFIDNVEIKTRDDSDVRPYVQSVAQEWVEVELPTELKSIKKYLEECKNKGVKRLLDYKIIHSPYTTKSQLIKLQQELARKKTGYGFMAMSIIAEIIKVDHALLLLETQCLYSLAGYLEDLKNDGSKAVARLLKDVNFQNAVRLTDELVGEGKEHPKIEKLRSIVEAELQKNKESRIIIFAQYRSTIRKIHDMLKNVRHAAPIEFIGQAKKKGSGLSQKEQVQILNEFKLGFYNILCASQVAEEGLDVVETDVVIFYEPVPSAIRKIQRAGRTARTRSGRVIVLIAKNTRDEAYHWVAHHKENKMKKILYDMKRGQNKNTGKTEPYTDAQKNLEDFGKKYPETNSFIHLFL